MLLSDDNPLRATGAKMKAARPTQRHFLAEQACKVCGFSPCCRRVSCCCHLPDGPVVSLAVHRHSRLICKKGRVGWVCVFVYIYKEMCIQKRYSCFVIIIKPHLRPL